MHATPPPLSQLHASTQPITTMRTTTNARSRARHLPRYPYEAPIALHPLWAPFGTPTHAWCVREGCTAPAHGEWWNERAPCIHRGTTPFYLEPSNLDLPFRWVLASLGRYLGFYSRCHLGTTSTRRNRAWIPSGSLGGGLLRPCWRPAAWHSCRRGHPQPSTWMVLGSRMRWGLKPSPNTQDHPVWAPLA